MIPTAAIRNLIREGKTHQIRSSIQTGQRYGMQTLEDSLVGFVQSGRLERSVAEQRANEVGDLRRLLDNAGEDGVRSMSPALDPARRELTAL